MTKLLRSSLIAMFILIITLACVVFTSTTYAVWQRKVTADKEVEIPVGEYNPSLKYLKFAGLNSEMEFVSSGITQYAVVGYDGLVAEIIIPSVHNVDGTDYPVVMIATDPSMLEFRFSNNEIITSIKIPASVAVIRNSTFAGLTSLRKVTIEGTSEDNEINIGDMAFASCVELDQFICERPIIGNSALYFSGTPLA